MTGRLGSAVAVLLMALLWASEAEALRRHALVVGHNKGLVNDDPLRFAETDARRVGQVLTEIGGVAREDLLLLLSPSASELKAALARKGAGLGADDHLLVYISGHAADGDLHLGGTTFPMRELRTTLDAMPAAVVVLVLDTCASGSIIRKGLRVAPGSPPVAVTETPPVRGRVIIGASSAEGVAQESELLGGSVFTQHLLAGLRGAADVVGDGQVTLQEAYTYASQRTLDSTFDSQHPIFFVQLAGERDLVLSEVGRGRSRLHLDFPEPGEWLLSSVDGGTVVSKFVKGRGAVTLAVDPGTYRIQGMTGDGARSGIVVVPSSGMASLTVANLRPAEIALWKRKGSSPAWELGIGLQAGPAALPSAGLLYGGSLGLRRVRMSGPLLLGADLRYRLGPRAEDSQMEHEVELLGDVGMSALRWSWGELRLLAQAGALYIRLQGASGALNGVGPRFGLASELVFRFSRLALAITGGGGVALYRAADDATAEAKLRVGGVFPFGGRLLWEY